VRIVRLVVRAALSLACALVAVWCVYRGMRHLFGFEHPPGAASRVASLAGVGPALGYFVAGVLSLLAAGELYPKQQQPPPPPPPPPAPGD
jgi:hypothetical protein